MKMGDSVQVGDEGGSIEYAFSLLSRPVLTLTTNGGGIKS